jgi:hypothetical protein
MAALVVLVADVPGAFTADWAALWAVAALKAADDDDVLAEFALLKASSALA